MASHTPAQTENVHATTIAVAGFAAMLRGPSGSGKSDLALRCLALAPTLGINSAGISGPLIAAPPMLVADDRTIVSATADGLSVSAPPQIAGRIEVRGLGIIPVPALARARLALVVDLVTPDAIERLPAPCEPAVLCGREVPRIILDPFDVSAPIKLVLALARAASLTTQ